MATPASSIPSPGELRVLFDGYAFVQHRRSGMTRYQAELIAAFEADPTKNVRPVMPYRFVSNLHLAAADPTFHALPLPHRWRAPVLGRLNRRWDGLAKDVDLVHAVTHLGVEPEGDTPVVLTVHDFTYELMPALFEDVSDDLRRKARWLDRASAVICVSEATRADLRRFHPEFDRPVVVAPHAVSAAFTQARRTPLRGLPDRYLLHVGNRHRHKNVDLLLRAFAEIAPRDPDLHLVLTGAGLPAERDLLDELGIAHRTHVMKVSDARLPSLYACAEAFVFPSLYEGFGLPLLEAMASGCPVVMSEIPASLEVAGDAALTVDPRDVGGLVSAIERITRDRALAASLRDAGRRRAEMFTWDRSAQLTATAYDRAVHG